MKQTDVTPRGWIVAAAVMLVVLGGGAQGGEFDVGVSRGRDLDEWVAAVTFPVSGYAQLRYTYDTMDLWQSAWYAALPPGGDDPSDWINLSRGWTSTAVLDESHSLALVELDTADYRNGEWEVWVILSRVREDWETDPNPAQPQPTVPFPEGFLPDDPGKVIAPADGPFDFEAKNLTIPLVGLTTTPAVRVDDLFFAAVIQESVPVMWHVYEEDGTAIQLDPAVNPNETSTTFSLDGFGGGCTITKVTQAPGAISDNTTGLSPGFYYMDGHATQQHGDSAQYYSPYLSLAPTLDPEWTGPPDGEVRSGLFRWQFRLLNGNLEYEPSAHRYRRFVPGANVYESIPLAAGMPHTPWVGTNAYYCPFWVYADWMSFPWAGSYYFGFSYQDDQADLYRDGVNDWCVPVGMGLTVPSCVTMASGADAWFEPDAHLAYARLGRMESGSRSTFYAVRKSMDSDGDGVIVDPSLDQLVDALSNDAVVVYRGHGVLTPALAPPETYVEEPDGVIKTAAPGPPEHIGLDLGDGFASPADLDAALGSSSLSACKLVQLQCCALWQEGSADTQSFAGVVRGHGAGAVVAFYQPITRTGSEYFHARFWKHLAEDAQSVWTAAHNAQTDTDAYLTAIGQSYDYSQIDTMRCLGEGTGNALAPAF